jgi:YVTN family beta-propeller protein
LTKGPFLLATLEIMILMSAILLSHNNTSAQTYDTITKQRETFKNNPQIPIGSGTPQNVQLIAVSPTTNRIYVPNPDSSAVSVIDSNTGNVTNIRVGTSPSAIVTNPASNKIYVANSGSNTVSVINGDSDKKEAIDIPVGQSPGFLWVHPSNNLGGHYGINKIYVANSGSNTVSVINASDDKKEPIDIPVGCCNPNAIMGVQGTRAAVPIDKIYVANSGSNTVSVINAFNDKEIRQIIVGMNPSAIAPGPADKIYVANLNGNVSVINTTNDKEISQIPVGMHPSAIALSGFSSINIDNSNIEVAKGIATITAVSTAIVGSADKIYVAAVHNIYCNAMM